MSEQKTQKKNWLSRLKVWSSGLKPEFKKIVWPDKITLAKQTVAVVSVTVVLGIMIAVIDFIIQNGVDLLVM